MSASQSNVKAAYGQNATVNFILDIDPATVEYHISIGTITGGSITVPSTTAAAGEMIVVTVIPDSGKIFKEGSLKYNDGTDHSISGSTFIMPVSDIVVTADFEDVPQITWTVVFDKNGGDTEANPASKTVVSGESSSTLLTAPARAGYTFKGWNTAVDGSGTVFTASTMVNSNITVYAQWKRNTSGSAGKLYPSDTTTRAEMAQVLYNLLNK